MESLLRLATILKNKKWLALKITCIFYKCVPQVLNTLGPTSNDTIFTTFQRPQCLQEASMLSTAACPGMLARKRAYVVAMVYRLALSSFQRLQQARPVSRHRYDGLCLLHTFSSRSRWDRWRGTGMLAFDSIIASAATGRHWYAGFC